MALAVGRKEGRDRRFSASRVVVKPKCEFGQRVHLADEQIDIAIRRQDKTIPGYTPKTAQ